MHSLLKPDRSCVKPESSASPAARNEISPQIRRWGKAAGGEVSKKSLQLPRKRNVPTQSRDWWCVCLLCGRESATKKINNHPQGRTGSPESSGKVMCIAHPFFNVVIFIIATAIGVYVQQTRFSIRAVLCASRTRVAACDMALPCKRSELVGSFQIRSS